MTEEDLDLGNTIIARITAIETEIAAIDALLADADALAAATLVVATGGYSNIEVGDAADARSALDAQKTALEAEATALQTQFDAL